MRYFAIQQDDGLKWRWGRFLAIEKGVAVDIVSLCAVRAEREDLAEIFGIAFREAVRLAGDDAMFTFFEGREPFPSCVRLAA